MSFKNYLITLCPPKYSLPILFYFKQLIRSLDLVDDTKAIFSHKNRGKVNNFIFKPSKIN